MNNISSNSIARSVTCWMVVGIFFFTACKSSVPFQIEDKPIQFDSTRSALSLQYMQEHYGMDLDTPTINPQMIVIHWTAIPSFQKTFEVFDPPTLRNTRPDIKEAGTLNVSAHYLIDRDGHIAQLLPDTIMARHVIGLNHTAIGIENVGGPDLPLTDAQLQANTWLVRRLVKQHDITYLIGHYEYKMFEGHPLWKEKDEGYRTDKNDPGIAFMYRLRNKVDGLKLKGASSSQNIPEDSNQ